jgi:hypothetical protein
MAPLLPRDRCPRRLTKPSYARALAPVCAWGSACADEYSVSQGGEHRWTVALRLSVVRQTAIRRQPDARPTRVGEARFLAETGLLDQELEGAPGQNRAQDRVGGRLVVEGNRQAGKRVRLLQRPHVAAKELG